MSVLPVQCTTATIVDRVLKSWTALQVALSLDTSSRGKPDIEYSDFVSRISSHLDESIAWSNSDYKLSEMLYDILADEFNVILDDDSHVQVARTLVDLMLAKQVGIVELQNKLDSLPPPHTEQSTFAKAANDDSQESASSSEEDATSDSENSCHSEGWTKQSRT
ncbi:hypothetical protein GJ496_009828 [Pomphorhynchus laevis]|nr:hypothetical protein GJ496_009828 [Pomphorhynchus laevis]